MTVELKEHVVAYVDLLGFGSAVSSRDPNALEGAFKVLTAFAADRREFEISSTRGATQLAPATYVFSDHVVLSFPTADLQQHQLKLSTTLDLMRYSIGSLAKAALDAGFLIRGGVTVGDLYQRNGVIFGPALVEAHELESTVAIYPRVIVSQRLLDLEPGTDWVCAGEDGLECLDYLTPFLASESPSEIAWRKSAKQQMNVNAKVFRKAGKLRAAANWTWMENYFSSASIAATPTIS